MSTIHNDEIFNTIMEGLEQMEKENRDKEAEKLCSRGSKAFGDLEKVLTEAQGLALTIEEKLAVDEARMALIAAHAAALRLCRAADITPQFGGK